MKSPAIDVKDLLLTLNLNLTWKDNLHVSSEPAEPNNVVTIYDTPGGTPDILLNDERYERPSIQIRVRNTSYYNGMNLSYDIYRALHGKKLFLLNGITYTLVRCTSLPYLLERDENQRVIIVTNYQLQRR